MKKESPEKEGGVKKEGDVKAHKRQTSSSSSSSSSSDPPELEEVPKSPYPKFKNPSPEMVQVAVKSLSALQGEPKVYSRKPVLDSLISTMLSQNTTDTTSHRAFTQLKTAFKTWESARVADVAQVEVEIRCCGLSQIRAERIQLLLQQIHEEKRDGDTLGLEYVRSMTNDKAKKELCRFKGVGPKTAACVLMFCMDRAEFPVDTHVWRICKNLNWCPPKASREECYAHMNAVVPDQHKYNLHVLLVAHGKCCAKCAKNGKPRKAVLGPCPLKASPMRGSVLKISPTKRPQQIKNTTKATKKSPASSSSSSPTTSSRSSSSAKAITALKMKGGGSKLKADAHKPKTTPKTKKEHGVKRCASVKDEAENSSRSSSPAASAPGRARKRRKG